MIKLILQGLVVGVANIIPGVSGGTMMVAMGLYDRLIHAVTHLFSEFKQSIKLVLPILIGAALAIVGLARLFEYLLTYYPIPTNFAFCGLIAGSLPFICKKVEGKKINVSRIIPFIFFFCLVIMMATLGDPSSKDADVSFSLVNVILLFIVGVIAASTMVIPGISGSMMLMLLGYYDVILRTINQCIDALLAFNISGILQACGVLVPFGIGVIVGIFAIAKLIEWIFGKAETHAYYGIIGLILASPFAILLNTDWSGVNLPLILVSIVTFILGWIVSSKLGGE